jgi:hypothetical protein
VRLRGLPAAWRCAWGGRTRSGWLRERRIRGGGRWRGRCRDLVAGAFEPCRRRRQTERLAAHFVRRDEECPHLSITAGWGGLLGALFMHMNVRTADRLISILTGNEDAGALTRMEMVHTISVSSTFTDCGKYDGKCCWFLQSRQQPRCGVIRTGLRPPARAPRPQNSRSPLWPPDTVISYSRSDLCEHASCERDKVWPASLASPADQRDTIRNNGAQTSTSVADRATAGGANAGDSRRHQVGGSWWK